MDLLFFIFGFVVAFVPIYAHDSFLQPYRISTDINSYGINRRGYSDRNVLMSSRDCYDLCYDAHSSGASRSRIAGCMCSRFDFIGVEFGGGFTQNQRRYTTSCNCPRGTVCVRSNGRRQCIQRSTVSRPTTRNYNYPVNTGLPRRLGGHCGYLSSVCQASQRDLNQQVRFTYNYSLRRCVRERVHSICNPLGPRNNIFSSLRTCNRMCL